MKRVQDFECEACSKKLTASPNEAYEIGWDTAPYFTGYVKCENCPITNTALWIMWKSGYGKE